MRFIPLFVLLLPLSAFAGQGPPAPTTIPMAAPTVAVETAPTDAERIQRGIVRRSKLSVAHQATGIATVVTMFTGQGFGLANRIAMGTGTKREDLTPTLMVHRIAAGISIGGYIGTGVLGLAMPGVDGTMKSKFAGGMGLNTNKHAALAIGHLLSFLLTGVTGALSANVALGTPAYEPLLATHQVAAGATAGLLLTSILIAR
jgi:hypothetical protein